MTFESIILTYGLRAITPLVIGMSGYDPKKFALLNLLGVALWSTVISLAGYAFGGAFRLMLTHVKRIEHWVVLGIIVVAFVP